MATNLGTMSIRLQAITKGFHTSLNLASKATSKTAKSFKVMGSSAKAAGRNIQGLQANVLTMNNVLVGLTGFALTRFITKTIEAGGVMQAFERRISVLSNSMTDQKDKSARATKEMDWLKETALKTGSAFDELSKAYTRLIPMAAANGISVEKIKQALLGTIGAGVVMGATTQEMGRAFIALGQIVGKDSLQMEELRQQLGEALPNAMLIAADGLTKLRRETDAGASQVSISELVKLINQSAIDGGKFIEIWTRGTKQYEKFAEAASNTVAGQVQNLKTNLTVGLGTFMDRSGIQNNITAMMQSLNASLNDFFSMADGDAETFGNKIMDRFEDIAGTAYDIFMNISGDISALFSALVDAGSFIGEFVSNAISTIRTLPFGDTIMSVGLIGFLFFGAKGKIFAGLLMGAAALLDETVQKARDADEKIAKNRNELYAKMNKSDGRNSEFSQGAAILSNWSIEDKLRPIEENSAMDTIKKAFPGKKDFMEFFDLDPQGRAEKSYAKFVKINDAYNNEVKKREALKADLGTKEVQKQGLAPEINALIEKTEAKIAALAVERAALQKVNDSISGFIPQEVRANTVDKVTEGLAGNATKQAAATKKAENALTKFIKSRRAQAEEIKKANNELKAAALRIPTTESTPFASMTLNQIQNFKNKYAGILLEFEGMASPVGKIAKTLQRDIGDYNSKIKLISHEGGFATEVTAIKDNIYKKAIRSATNIKGSDNLAELENDIKTRREFIKSIVGKMGVDDGFGNGGPSTETQEFIDAELAQLELREKSARSKTAKLEHRKNTAGLNLELEKVREINAAGNAAIDMIVTKINHQKEFNILAQIEKDAVAKGVKSKEAALTQMTNGQRENLAVRGTTETLEDNALKMDVERSFYGDKGLSDARKLNTTARIKLEITRAQKALEEGRDPAIEAANRGLAITQIQQERENLRMKLDLMGTEGYQEENFSLEYDKLILEQAILEQKMGLMNNETVRGEMIDLEMQKMAMERENLELKLELMQTDGYQEGQDQQSILESQIEMQELMGEWGMDFNTFWQTEIIGGVRQWQQLLQSGITNFVMGTGSMKDAFKGFIKSALGGIVSFFAKFISQKILAWAIEIGLISTGSAVAMAATTAAGAAAEAAWTPAAVAASIATFGGALAFGPMAIAQIQLARLGSSALGGGSSAFGPGMGGGGIVGGPGYHDGGMIENVKRTSFSGLTGLKPGELMKKVQVGEMVVPRSDVDGTLDAINFAKEGMVGLGTNDYSGFDTSSDLMSDDDIEEMSRDRSPDIVNYFDYEDVNRHMTDNPDAVLNIIATDNRNNGAMRGLMRS